MKQNILYEAVPRRFEIPIDSARRELQIWICCNPCTWHLTITSCCCDTVVLKDTSSVKQGVASFACMKYLVCKDDTFALAHSAKRYETDKASLCNKFSVFWDEPKVMHSSKGKRPPVKIVENSKENYTNIFWLFIKEILLAYHWLVKDGLIKIYTQFSIEALLIFSLSISKTRKNYSMAFYYQTLRNTRCAK